MATDFPNSQTESSTVATGVGLVSDQWPVSQQQEEGLKRVEALGMQQTPLDGVFRGATMSGGGGLGS